MPKKTASPTLPPLSVQKLDELESEEWMLRKKLSSCVYGDSYNYDTLKASEYLRAFAVRIFDSYHEYFAQASSYSLKWTEKLKADTTSRIMRCFVDVCSAEDYVLKSYEIEVNNTIDDQIRSIVETANAELGRKLLQPPSAYAASKSPLLIMAEARAAHPKPSRLSSQITSPSAARKMEAFMEKNALNQTEFAIQANTSDKTIRKFRQTGKVKRSILTGIASAMGITKEELLRL